MSKKRVVKQKTHKDDDYEKQIRKLEKENRRLKSEVKTLQEALNITDDYLVAITKDKTLGEVMQDVKENQDVTIEEKCPNCGNHDMKKINLGTTKIVACTRCPYRNRVHEQGTAAS